MERRADDAWAQAMLKRLYWAARFRMAAVTVKSRPLRQYARRLLGWQKPYGVNLVGYIRAEMGLGEVARGVAAALDAARIPFDITNFEHGNHSPHTNLSWAHKETGRSDYGVTILCINPDNRYSVRTRLPRRLLSDQYVIGYWFWELPELPEGWETEFGLVNEVWAGSDFIREAVARKATVPVVRMPPVVSAAGAGDYGRAHFRLPEGRYLFLSVCDAHSVLERKNPLGVVSAFKKAFRKNDPRVGLVLKFNNPEGHKLEFDEIRSELEGYDNVYMLEQVMTRSEVNSLIAATDCLVSLHRSEGFGLVPAEAMLLGKPVVLTNWSGNTDYMTPENSVGIDYELVKLGRDYGLYKAHQHWAEPDIEQAARWMRRIAEEPGLGESIGRSARATVESGYSPEAVGRLIRERLDQILRESR